MKAKLVWVLFVVVAACAVAAAIQVWNRRAGSKRAPDFHLVERSGREVSRRGLVGQVWIADFVFTRCQGPCQAMNSLMYELQERVPGVRFVSFTVDPSHDTPEHLAGWVETQRLSKGRWDWLSGVPHERMQEIANGFLLPAGLHLGEVVHSDRFVLIDRYGRVRGYYSVLDGESYKRVPREVTRLEADSARVAAEPYLPVAKLPTVNAGLNATTFVLLISGLCCIKAKRIGAHKGFMLAALSVSAVFLVSYLTTHYYLGSTPYPGQGMLRPVYFTILLTHTVLAGVVAVLAPLTVYRAFRGQIDRHKALARWTLPIWLYVSVTGVVIYFMLYGW